MTKIHNVFFYQEGFLRQEDPAKQTVITSTFAFSPCFFLSEMTPGWPLPLLWGMYF